MSKRLILSVGQVSGVLDLLAHANNLGAKELDTAIPAIGFGEKGPRAVEIYLCRNGSLLLEVDGYNHPDDLECDSSESYASISDFQRAYGQ